MRVPFVLEADGKIVFPNGSPVEREGFSLYAKYLNPAKRSGYLEVEVEGEGWDGSDSGLAEQGIVLAKIYELQFESGEVVDGPDSERFQIGDWSYGVST